MRIVVNHLTRMRPGYICVAGLVKAGGPHIRPVLERGLPDRLLATKQGPFAIGAIVALAGASPAGRPPETEDHRFNSWKATREGTVAPDAFWTLLTQSSQDRLAAIFGPGLQRHGQTCAVDPGAGRVSLGCLRPAQTELYVDLHDKVRLRLADGEHAVSVAVADLRFYGPDFSDAAARPHRRRRRAADGRRALHPQRGPRPPLPQARRHDEPPLAAGQQPAPGRRPAGRGAGGGGGGLRPGYSLAARARRGAGVGFRATRQTAGQSARCRRQHSRRPLLSACQITGGGACTAQVVEVVRTTGGIKRS